MPTFWKMNSVIKMKNHSKTQIEEFYTNLC